MLNLTRNTQLVRNYFWKASTKEHKDARYVVVDDAFYPVSPGDVAYIPPDSLHSVINESEGELMWAAFWWDIMAPQERSGSPDKEEKHDECDVFNDR